MPESSPGNGTGFFTVFVIPGLLPILFSVPLADDEFVAFLAFGIL